MKEILKLDHIQKYYGSEGGITKAIRDISFTVEEGEFLGIMGSSGSGKTTLLNCISTIDTVSAGHIYLDGEDVTEIRPKALARFRREKLGFVFQDFNLLDTLTIGENIALVLSINHTPPAEVEPCVEEMARRLNIQDILHKYPYQVSGGQRQRCACARALIHGPRLLLADEPTGALDSHSAQMLLNTFEGIHTGLGATILMVTHDADYPEQTAEGVGYGIRLRTLQVNSARANNFVLQAAMLYDGVVLMVICLTVLSLQQLLDAGQYRYRFSVLHRLGVEESRIRRLVLGQLGFWFGLPVGAAVLVGAGAAGCFIAALRTEIEAYIGFGPLAVQLGITAAILAALLGCYFISTWVLFRRAIDA